MIGKKFGFYAVSLILAFALAACGRAPENTDINTPYEEITFTEKADAFETVNESVSRNTQETTEDITPEEITDKLPDTESEKSSDTEKTEITPEIKSETKSKAESKTPPKETSESITQASDTSEPVTAAASSDVPNTVTETSAAEITAQTKPITTTAAAATEPVFEITTESVTEPSATVTPETEPPATEPPLTGGAYNQRYCTEREAEFAEKVFELTNLVREKEGLPKFEKMDTLKNIALTRAWELTVEYRADHSRPDGSVCTGAFNENGIIYGGWAENIAAGQDTPESVVDAWMNSPSHREAILNKDYTFMGVGYYYIKDDYQNYYHFWTQEFYHY